MKARQTILLLLVVLGVGAYWLLFFASPLPSLESLTGRAWRRIDFFQFLLVPEALLEQWFGSPPQFSVLDRLPIVAIAAAILACATGVGWLLLSACRADRRLTALESYVFSTAVGLNALSTYMLLVGLFGWLGSRWIVAVPALPALGAAVRWWMARRGSPASGAHVGGAVPNHRGASLKLALRAGEAADPQWSRHWLWLAAPFVLVILLGGTLPPIDFDVREYHLQTPKEFFQQGRIEFLPHNVYGNMPLGSEMLCLLAMVLAGDWWLGALAGKTVLAAMTPLAALGLLAAGRRFFSAGAGVVAAVVYLSIPWIVQVSSSGLVEGASACFLLLSGYAMFFWQDVSRTLPSAPQSGEVRSAKWIYLALAGYLAGGAVSCKYPAVVFVVIPLAAWILLAHVPGRLRLAWKPLAVFLLAALLGCGLWLAKNWALTGNPTYPLLSEAFDGTTRTPEKDQQWNRVHRPTSFSFERLRFDLLQVGLRSEWLSPLVMPLAALGLLSRKHRRRTLVLLAWFAYTVAAWWLLTHRIDRFWVPGLSLLSLAAGVGTCWTADRWFRTLLVPLVMVMGLAYNFLAVTSGAGGYNRYFVSLQRLRTDPERVDPWHRYFNAHVTEGCVLMVGDAQVFDLEVPVLYNTCFDDSIFEQLVKGRTADQVRAALAERHVSFVYVHWGEIARYRQSGYGFTDFVRPAVFDDLVRQRILEPLPAIEGHSGRGYRVTPAVP